jgi:hypothetical protein
MYLLFLVLKKTSGIFRAFNYWELNGCENFMGVNGDLSRRLTGHDMAMCFSGSLLGANGTIGLGLLKSLLYIEVQRYIIVRISVSRKWHCTLH